jgi:glucokinase
MSRGDYALGIDLGGTRIKAVALAPQGGVVDQRLSPTDEADLPRAVRTAVDGMVAAQGPPRWIGLAAPGIVEPGGRAVWWMAGRLEQLVGFDWGEFLERPGEVPVLNDAQAALMGEVAVGAARGCDHVALFTLGTGVGGALLIDGRLLRGAIGRAGHLGHVCLDPDGPPSIAQCPGSLEYAIGNYSIARRTGGRYVSTQAMLDAMSAGDPGAREFWLRSVRQLAAAIVSVVNAVDPALVILGGGIARAGPELFQPLERELDRFEWRPHGHRVRIVPAQGGQFAGAVGAAYHAWHRSRDKDAS